MATMTLAHMPDPAKVHLEAAHELAEANGNGNGEAATARSRAALIAEMTAARDAEAKWLTTVYKAMVAFQKDSDDYARRTGRTEKRVCLQNFNPWLRGMGFPSPADETRGIPDPDAPVAAYGGDVNLDWYTIAGLRSVFTEWQAQWAKRRDQIRSGIIKGVDAAHGNFSRTQRDEALTALGLELPKKKVKYNIYVRMPVTLDHGRAQPTAMRNKLVAALEAAYPEGTPRGIADYIDVSHETIDEGYTTY